MAKEIQTTTIRIEADDMRALKRVAVGLDRTVSSCIRIAVNDFVKRNRAASAKGTPRPARKRADVVAMPAPPPDASDDQAATSSSEQ